MNGRKVSNSGTSIYAYDGDNLVEETNSSGSVVARYSQGLNIDEPLAEVRSGTTSYYEVDGLGSVMTLSNAAGAVANNYTYDSFGNLVATSGSIVNNFRYTGREWDAETSLYYYRARYYDPSAGRFKSEDPLGSSVGVNNYWAMGNNQLNTATLKLPPIVIRCGTPDCDWGWPMADLAAWRLQKCYAAFRLHCIEMHGLSEHDRKSHMHLDIERWILTLVPPESELGQILNRQYSESTDK